MQVLLDEILFGLHLLQQNRKLLDGFMRAIGLFMCQCRADLQTAAVHLGSLHLLPTAALGSVLEAVCCQLAIHAPDLSVVRDALALCKDPKVSFVLRTLSCQTCFFACTA